MAPTIPILHLPDGKCRDALMPATEEEAKDVAASLSFPPDFLFGAATSAYQLPELAQFGSRGAWEQPSLVLRPGPERYANRRSAKPNQRKVVASGQEVVDPSGEARQPIFLHDAKQEARSTPPS